MTQRGDDELFELTAEMDRHLADVVNGVQDAREVRAEAYAQAEALGRKLAAMLKGREFVPRRTLLVLDVAAKALENGAAHAKDPSRVTQMARAIRMTSGLILRGESHDDRKPGVPRVI